MAPGQVSSPGPARPKQTWLAATDGLSGRLLGSSRATESWTCNAMSSWESTGDTRPCWATARR